MCKPKKYDKMLKFHSRYILIDYRRICLLISFFFYENYIIIFEFEIIRIEERKMLNFSIKFCIDITDDRIISPWDRGGYYTSS